MRRLKGPLDVYGTVYGVSTMVVHVAHPKVALAILNGASVVSKPRGEDPARKPRRRISLWQGSGASKAPAYNHFRDFCGQGVFTTDGTDWKAKRAAVMHALLRSPKGGYETRIKQQAEQTADTLVAHLLRNHCNGKEVNLTPVLQRVTIGLIYRYITDHDLWNGFVDTERNATKSAEGLDRYLDAITRIRMIILAQSRSLWFLMPRWLYRKCSSLFDQEQECMISIGAMARQACQNAQPGSPLQMLRTSPVYHLKPGEGNHSQNLLDEAITLLFAGQDTSAATLSWTLHLLSLHPEVQKRLAEEVASCDEEKVRSQNFKDLVYLDAVLKEAMRLYPVAPFVVRRVSESISVEDSRRKESVILPEHALACIWIYSLHRNDRYWSRPDDFFPERWLEAESERDEGISNGAFMPFCSGPRNCVGQPLAYYILRTLLVKLVENFEFVDTRLKEGVDADSLRHEMQAGFTVLPLGGVPLVLRKRL